jgi:RNA-directed DNA polymerase
MAKNRLLLFEKVKHVLASKVNKLEIDNVLLLSLIEKVIFNDPTKNCIIKGEKSDWHGLPKSKSLFYAQENCGLPIGNLTSQLVSVPRGFSFPAGVNPA